MKGSRFNHDHDHYHDEQQFHIINMIICMQSNFEKLTREELVIVEAENVLQPAAIQKVLDHKN